MKKLLLISVFAVLSCGVVFAGEDWKPSATLRSDMVSKYLSFSTGTPLSDRPAVQTDLCFPLPAGFRVGFWNSTGLDGNDPSCLGNECDYYAGWTGSFGKFGVDVSFYYFDEPKLLRLGSGDLLNPNIELNYSFKNGITPFVKWVGYVSMPDSGFDGGNVFQLGVRYVFDEKSVVKLPSYVSVPVQSVFSWDDGVVFNKPGVLWKGTVEANWHVTKWLDINAPCLAVYAPITVENMNPHGTDIVAYAGVTVKF